VLPDLSRKLVKKNQGSDILTYPPDTQGTMSMGEEME
jgi:hypothetical protein